MVTAGYVPDRGDVIWLDFDPQAGHEHKGRRPAFVLSPQIYNRKTGLMLCCPITSQVKGYPFEVAVSGVTGIRGVILADQVKSLDWRARRAEKDGKVTRQVLEEVVMKVRALVEG
uniref:endoribonuclease MazF n=1 Tax=Geomonas terrae TaxID=2562681 RepID=UPI0038B32576